jgi:hypothetical protein
MWNFSANFGMVALFAGALLNDRASSFTAVSRFDRKFRISKKN